MNGQTIKRLLISSNIDLNKYQYFENDKTYDVGTIPKIKVKMDILRKKICEKYGEKIGNYILDSTYSRDDNMVEPKKILKLLKNLKYN